MKKIIPLFLVILCFTKCNQADDSKSTAAIATQDSLNRADSILKMNPFIDVCNNPGLGNVSIRRSLADSMTKHFKEIYETSLGNNIITDSFFVDACTIIALSRFLDADAARTGLRIVFAAEKTADEKGNKTKMFLVTTKDTSRNSQTTTRDDKWDISIPGTDCGNSRNYFSNFRSAVTQIQSYDQIFRGNLSSTATAPKDSLSKKVWIDKCIISKLAAYMLQHNSIDGLNIKLGAYYAKDTVLHPGQAYDNQSTVVLIPTTNKIDDWTVVEQIRKATAKKFFDAGLNHGSLCPQICE